MNAPVTIAPNIEALAIDHARSKGYESHPVRDRESWLRMRGRDVTASTSGALFGVHEYQTAYGLWALKSGLIGEDAEETAPMRRGRLLEPVAIEMLREERPTWRVERARSYFRDPGPNLGATPDAFVIDPSAAGFGIAQLKTVEPSVFRRKWRSESGEIEPPLWIAVQAVVEAELTGASWACVVAMVCSFGIDLHVVPIPLHPGLMGELRTRVREFWRMVETKEAPPVDYARDGETLARMYGEDSGTAVDLSGDNMLPELAAEDERLASDIKSLEARRKELKTELLSKMGDAAVALMDGRVVATARTVHRKEFTARATSYRDVRFKRSA